MGGFVAGVVLEVVSGAVQQMRLVVFERLLPPSPVRLAERLILGSPQDQRRFLAETLEAARSLLQQRCGRGDLGWEQCVGTRDCASGNGAV